MEDIPSVIEKFKSFAKQNLLLVVLFLSGLLFLSIGLIQFFGQQKTEIEFQSGEELGASTGSEGKIYVDVSGEVLKPGVYDLKTDARIKDALISAGGLSEDADRQYVARYMNLAQKATDGMKIYVPKASEGLKNTANFVATGDSSATGIISINMASLGELDTLSGVGPVTAQKIIDNRPYGSLDELVSKKAVSQSVFSKIKEKISL